MHIHSFVQDDESAYGFTVFLRGNTGYLHVFYAFQLIEELFYLAGIDIFTTADNHVLDASCDAVIAVLVLHSKVSRVQETVLVNDFGRGFRVFVVTLHGVVSAVAHFTLYAYGTLFSGFGVDNLYFRMFKVVSYGIATYIERVVYPGGGHSGSSFGQPVNAGHLHVHFLFHLLHQLYRAEGTCHDTRTEAGHVEHVEHRMVQFGNEHGGYAVKCRAALLVDRGEHYQRVEAFHHYFCTAVCQAVHGGKYHAKAVEQWYADAELVIGGKLHVLTGKETVVGNVVVGKHDAFRESRSAGGVLHVHYIVASDLTFELIQATVFYIVAQEKYFGRVVHAPVLLLPHVDDIFHIRETFAFQVSALAGLQFRKHGIGHLHKVTVLFAIDDAEGMHVGVLAEIFQLGLFVVGVYRYVDGTYLGASV